MSEVSPKNFLTLLQKSGLCDSDELKASVNELFEKADGRPVNLKTLIANLMEAGLISDWHVKKLLAGRYKGFFLGKYKLWGHLGTGGMSTVYLAKHTIFNQMRAIKVLPKDRVADKTFLQRFYREGRAAAALNHRNIVRVYDIGQDADTHYLVMEYVKGQDISAKVKQHGPLPLTTAVDYTVQALTGLQHSHENDLIHRDIKPANLLVNLEGDVKILDLGLALFQEEDGSLTVMHDEKVLGTADYLPPEQAIDSHQVSSRSDLYSMGCTLYFMLTGQPPFPDGTIAQRIAMHQTRMPESVQTFRPDCPTPLAKVLEKMLQKNPDDRYQDCASLINDLRKISDELISQRIETPVKSKTAQRTKPAAAPPKKPRAKTPPQPTPAKPTPTASKPKQQPTNLAPKKKSPPALPEEKKSSTTQSRDAQSRPSKPPASKPSKSPSPQSTQLPKATAASRSQSKQSPASTNQAQSSKGTQKQAAQKQAAQKVPPKKTTPKPASEKPTQTGGVTVKTNEAPTGEAGSTTQAPVVVTDQAPKSNPIGISELQSFVKQNQPKTRVSAKPKRRSIKEQAIVAGIVIGMLLLLGVVLWAAMQFAA